MHSQSGPLFTDEARLKRTLKMAAPLPFLYVPDKIKKQEDRNRRTSDAGIAAAVLEMRGWLSA